MSDDAEVIAVRTAQIREYHDKLVAKDTTLRIDRWFGSVPFANIPDDNLEEVVVGEPPVEPVIEAPSVIESVIEDTPVAEEAPIKAITPAPVTEEAPAAKTPKPKAASKS